MPRIRIAGPGIPPPASRVSPKVKGSKVLVLAAILHEGVPTTVLDMYDTSDKVRIGHDDEPGVYRPCIYTVVSEDRGERLRMECGCRAGLICKQHGPAWSESWWRESKARDDARNWRAAGPEGDWIKYPEPDPPKRVSFEAALRDALTAGRPTVSCRNGHGKLLEVRPVDGAQP